MIEKLGYHFRLDLLAGRKLKDLRAYAGQHPDFPALKPKALVIDLAQAYHTWIRECFPQAIRIADRFHVHGTSSSSKSQNFVEAPSSIAESASRPTA